MNLVTSIKLIHTYFNSLTVNMILTTVCYTVEEDLLLICFDMKTKLIYTIFNVITLLFFIVVIVDMLIKKLKPIWSRNAVVPININQCVPSEPCVLFINVRDPQVNIINIDSGHSNANQDHIR